VLLVRMHKDCGRDEPEVIIALHRLAVPNLALWRRGLSGPPHAPPPMRLGATPRPLPPREARTGDVATRRDLNPSIGGRSHAPTFTFFFSFSHCLLEAARRWAWVRRRRSLQTSHGLPQMGQGVGVVML
jgi:hypothetical protein